MNRFGMIILVLSLVCSKSLLAQYGNSSNPNIDSLEQVLANDNLSDDERLTIYAAISRGFYVDPRRASHYGEKGIALAEETGDREILFYLYAQSAHAYYNLSSYDSSLMYCEKVIKLSSVINRMEERLELGRVLLDVGDIYGINNQFDEALDYLFRSMKIAEEVENKTLLMDIYGSIGYLYGSMKNYEQAENYYGKMKELSIATGDMQKLANALSLLSPVVKEAGRPEDALKYAEEAYRVIMSYPAADLYDLMNACRSLSVAWSSYDLDKSLQYAKEALAYAEEYNNPLYKADILYGIALTQYYREEYAAAEQIAFQVLETDTTYLSLKGDLYQVISQANIMLGNKERAIAYLDRFSEWISDYTEQTYQASLSEMEAKYETEKKEIRIADLEKEKQLMVWLSIAGGVVLLLALAAFFFLWRWTVQKKRLAEKQQELAEQQIKQLEQEKQLVATQSVLDGEIQERTRLARDLHDGLGSMLTGTKMNIEELKKEALCGDIEVEHIDHVLMMLNDSSHELRRIAHHLMPDSLSRFGLKMSVGDFCSTLPHVDFAWYGDEGRLEAKLETMIYRTIHELVNNALKHAGASHILVQVIQDTSRIAFTVQDDGCGFDVSAVSQGMGLQNIRTRVASFGGIMNVVSAKGEGTEINVELRMES